ncbi:MAG: DUF1624 domain-containing protein [Polyangiales bacterium]
MSRDKSHRLAAIDLLRGAVMVLMVLDHTRDFFMVQGVRATDLSQTTTPLFFTRWVTHFCAPGFVFLAGSAIFLAAQRRSARERTRFLVTRGLFLVVLELTVVKFGWAPEPFYYFLLLQVIWAIGWSMVAMAGISFLPSRIVGGLGVLALVLAPLWENAEGSGAMGVVLTVLTGTGVYHPIEGHTLIVGYAILPWLALMMCGFGFGELAKRADFPRWSLVFGVALSFAFVGLRFLNVYGDPEPWTSQSSATFTLLSFLNTSKYPPSLLFLLMTLGPLLVALSLLSRVDASRAPWRWLLVFGRVPLFYYVLHLWLLRVASIACAFVVWGFGPEAYSPPPEGHAGNPGWSLAVVYLVWALALLVLYRPSRAFVELKRRRDDWWLAYL